MTHFRCLVLVSSAIFGLATGVAADDQRPNVVIILVDDMGYGDPGCYNAESKIPTLNIDSLAAAGMRFTDAHASGPLCHMSRYGLVTGRYPFRTDVSRWARQPLIDDGATTIASLLKSQGYRTAMVGKWHLGFDESQGYERPLPGGPVDVGFDSYFGIRASTDIPPYFYIRDRRAVQPPTNEIAANNSDGWSPIQGAFWRAGGIAPDLELKDVLPRFTDEAIDVIRDHADRQVDAREAQPLMLYLAYPAPHTPWLPSDAFVGTSQADMYGDFAVMVDTMIGRVLRALDSAGMAGNTLVVFASDNGPTWYQKDVERFGHDSSGGLRGMKADAWEAGHRVPFVVRWPGKIQAGSVSDQLVSFVDLLATLAAITDFELPDGAGPDSHDFSAVLLGTQPADQPVRTSLALQSGSGFMTIREGHWKLIEGLGSGGFSQPSRITPGTNDPPSQLYNLKDDPAETTNLYSQNPEVVGNLRRVLTEILAAERTRDPQQAGPAPVRKSVP
ncbi:MAG: arylsulfatase [Planctomycetaceae bacterium]